MSSYQDMFVMGCASPYLCSLNTPRLIARYSRPTEARLGNYLTQQISWSCSNCSKKRNYVPLLSGRFPSYWWTSNFICIVFGSGHVTLSHLRFFLTSSQCAVQSRMSRLTSYASQSLSGVCLSMCMSVTTCLSGCGRNQWIPWQILKYPGGILRWNALDR